MFSHNHAKNWNPYTIPATPNVSGDDVFHLSCEAGADSGKNPSQFLKWKLGLPKGRNNGDILRWNSSVGNGGAWTILYAPQSSQLRVLTIRDGTLAWTATEECP